MLNAQVSQLLNFFGVKVVKAKCHAGVRVSAFNS